MTALEPPPPSFGPPGAPTIAPAPVARLPRASFGYRAGASLVDLGLVLAAGFLAGVVLGVSGGFTADVRVFAAVAVLVHVANAVVLAGANGGQTVGKKVAAIRTVRDDGRPYDHGTAALRDGLYRIPMAFPLLGLVDALSPLSSEKRTLRDKWSRTHVVREPGYAGRRRPLTAAAVAVVVVYVATVAASAGHRDYTAADRQAFMTGCARTGAMTEAQCGCAFARVRAQLPFAEYREADRTADASRWSPRVRAVVADAFRACLTG